MIPGIVYIKKAAVAMATLLSFFLFFAILSMVGALALNSQANLAYFAINIIQCLFNIVILFFKGIIAIPLVIGGIWDINTAILRPLWKTATSLGLSLIYFLLSGFSFIPSATFRMVTFFVELIIPTAVIPDGATAITVRMLLPSSLDIGRPAWFPASLWDQTVVYFLQQIGNIVLISTNTYSDINQFFLNQVVMLFYPADEVFWVEILEVSYPEWLFNLRGELIFTLQEVTYTEFYSDYTGEGGVPAQYIHNTDQGPQVILT